MSINIMLKLKKKGKKSKIKIMESILKSLGSDRGLGQFYNVFLHFNNKIFPRQLF